MAERRMFALAITQSDAFVDMPLSTQALYFHLGMNADDDGFISSPKRIMRMLGCGNDDLKLLVAKRFLIPFESGVVVIKHWRINNFIRTDRYKETVYQEEKAMLTIKENKAYTLGIPNDNQRYTQVRLGKDRLGKDNKHIVAQSTTEYPYKDVIEYLNQKAGTAYKDKSKDSRKFIKFRIDEGFTVDDFKTVIDKKVSEWSGTEMAKYIRPSTLFGNNFESYLNQKYGAKKNQFAANCPQRDYNMDDLERQLLSR